VQIAAMCALRISKALIWRNFGTWNRQQLIFQGRLSNKPFS
jgi:hypothetical protein